MEILNMCAEILKLPQDWTKQILLANGDGSYAVFAVKDNTMGFRIGFSSYDGDDPITIVMMVLYAMASAFNVPIPLEFLED